MAKDNTKLKSVCFPVEIDNEFAKIAQKYGRNKNLLFAQFVKYFSKTGKDPEDINDELLKNTLSKGIRTIISFIKTQEQDTLVPLLSNAEQTVHNIKKIAEFLTQELEEIGKSYQVIEDRTNKIYLNLGKIVSENRDNTKLILNAVQDKQTLKTKFLLEFKNYITERESLGLTSGSKAKEDLMGKYQHRIQQM